MSAVLCTGASDATSPSSSICATAAGHLPYYRYAQSPEHLQHWEQGSKDLSFPCVYFRWCRRWPVTVPTPFGSIHYWTPRRFRAVAGNLTPKIKSSKSRPAHLNIPNMSFMLRLKKSCMFFRPMIIKRPFSIVWRRYWSLYNSSFPPAS